MCKKYKDGIVTDTKVCLGWMDRIRVLLGKSINVYCNTQTENEVGAHVTESRVWIERVFKRKERHFLGEGRNNES